MMVHLQIRLRLCTAKSWLYEVPSESEYAIELCQKVVELIDESDDETQQASWWHRDKVAAILGMHYLKAAIAAKADGKDPVLTVTRLNSLAYYQQGGKRYVRALYNYTQNNYRILRLGRTLLCANDIPNSRVALGITLRPLELMNTDRDTDSAQGIVEGMEAATEAWDVQAHDQENDAAQGEEKYVESEFHVGGQKDGDDVENERDEDGDE
ncbi:hypothetical protein LTR78_007776 [Recurvomyces mirabilis]|uniref:Uncharacterized protein n=1 Tax=Recurvomyces mirabilis TaxID=574656 RepID=A0AAE0WJ65_9PEZI|nr:hypothetical protein LTR78_007776 [Recurvomyces mirabilis]KAK5151664.1 hypothetical protein LTS14_009151 [Recurvomyces mirabilis]